MHPNPLDLYRWAVQHPESDIGFLEKAYTLAFKEGWPTLLREDFAGNCALSYAWCKSDPDRRALAIDNDYDTCAHAAEQTADEEDLYILPEDVMTVDDPAVDLVYCGNFSIGYMHDKKSLRAYLKHSFNALDGQGLFVCDIYGGKGAQINSDQDKPVTPPEESGLLPYTYHWHQRHYDPVTKRVQCAIHFNYQDQHLENAFTYDWRLWSPTEILQLATKAGFDRVTLWCDRIDPDAQMADGRFIPTKPEILDDRFDWVAYIVAERWPTTS